MVVSYQYDFSAKNLSVVSGYQLPDVSFLATGHWTLATSLLTTT